MKISFSIKDIDILIRRFQADLVSPHATPATKAYAKLSLQRLMQAKEMLLAGKSAAEAWKHVFR